MPTPKEPPNTNETETQLKSRARKIVRTLRRAYPDAGCTLEFDNPLQLLIATILSAQSTDKLVNSLTPKLFEKYPAAEDWANAPLSQIEQDIKPTGFFRNKAKSIKGACRQIVEKHDGRVPDDMESLVALPGVGRKTANVLQAAVWGRPAIIVDTHVARISQRLGLTAETNADKIEAALQPVIAKKDWSFYSHSIILHGRAVCTAKKPDCPACPINKLCPSAFTFGVPAPTGWKSEIEK